MPETPDFEQIARSLRVTAAPLCPSSVAIAEQLRLVWNARGAADLAKIDLEFADDTLNLKSLDRALRSLDR